MQISESEFQEHLWGRVLYLCHRNADPDAIGSGFALKEAFGGDLGVVEDMSRSGERLAQELGAEPIINPRTQEYDLVVLVDTSARRQLGESTFSRYGIVDHHQDSSMLEGAEFYIQRPLDSTAEIVWKIVKGKSVSKEASLGLLVGIISDTGRFKHAKAPAFCAVGEILEQTGLEYAEALEILSTMPSDLSQRIAIIKAAMRASVDWVEEWIVVTTQVNAFEGAAAMALIDLGADIAFAAGRHGSNSRVSGRARRSTSNNINLAEIMRGIAANYNGEGGGHRGAAALEAPASPEVLLMECKKKALQILQHL